MKITQVYVNRDSKGVHIEFQSLTGSYAKSYEIKNLSNLFVVKAINEEVNKTDIPVKSLTNTLNSALTTIKLCTKHIINSKSLV